MPAASRVGPVVLRRGTLEQRQQLIGIDAPLARPPTGTARAARCRSRAARSGAPSSADSVASSRERAPSARRRNRSSSAMLCSSRLPRHDGGLAAVVPVVDDLVPRLFTLYPLGRARPSPHLRMQPERKLQHGQRRQAGGCSVGPDEGTQPGVQPAVHELHLDRVDRRSELAETSAAFRPGPTDVPVPARSAYTRPACGTGRAPTHRPPAVPTRCPWFTSRCPWARQV